MSELLEIYNLEGTLVGTENRDVFYKKIKKEFNEKGKITKQIKTIKLLLLNSSGRIYIQRRSDEKKENPGLYDKTIGGHIKAGHTLYMSVVQECHEELGFPAVILNDDEFRTAIKMTDLQIIGLFKRVEHISNFISVRKTKEGDIKQPLINSFYIGYYDGAIRFCDGESTGIEVFTLKQLKERIKKYPELFTDDLKFMIDRYKKYLIPIKKGITPVLGYEE